MNNMIRFAFIGATALGLTACATDGYDSGAGSSNLREASGNAESACMSAVNANYGGKVASVKVTSSETSQANSMVMVKASGVRGGTTTEHWKCLVSNDGNVEELSVVDR
jgi:starvation-inducible outer membrane lipoprotein